MLPTWNGEADLLRLLPALAQQRVEGGLEIVAIDSSSEDRSVELLESAGARVECIPKADFGHGATRNRGASRARGEYLVFLSQDATPAGPGTLEQLVAPFADPRVSGTYARVLPHPGDDPLTRRTVLEAPEASAEGFTRDPASLEGGFAALDAASQDAWSRFNNVASAVRADVFAGAPFPEVDFGEDHAWGRAILEGGGCLVFAADAVVHHAHRYSAREAFRRYRTDAEFHLRSRGTALRPNLLAVLRGFLFEVGCDLRFLAKDRGPGRMGALLRSPGLRGAQVFGQYLGGRGKRGAA